MEGGCEGGREEEIAELWKEGPNKGRGGRKGKGKKIRGGKKRRKGEKERKRKKGKERKKGEKVCIRGEEMKKGII